MEKQRMIYEYDFRMRLDEFISEQPGVHSRSYAGKIVRRGLVEVNDEIVKKAGFLLSTGDKLVFSTFTNELAEVQEEDISLDIIYEDNDMMVINKPPGIVVHPGAGNLRGTIAAGVIHHLRELPNGFDPLRPGIVHRLDKDTSGVLVVAKTSRALAFLAKQFKERMVKKHYNALVYGQVAEREGSVETLIGRHKTHRKKMDVTTSESRGRNAITEYRVKSHFSNPEDNLQKFSLVYVHLKTGRTHQIRVHMKHIGHPVVGDVLYTGRKMLRQNPEAPRQLLHACEIEIACPDGVIRKFSAELPDDMRQYISNLKPEG